MIRPEPTCTHSLEYYSKWTLLLIWLVFGHLARLARVRAVVKAGRFLRANSARRQHRLHSRCRLRQLSGWVASLLDAFGRHVRVIFNTTVWRCHLSVLPCIHQKYRSTNVDHIVTPLYRLITTFLKKSRICFPCLLINIAKNNYIKECIY